MALDSNRCIILIWLYIDVQLHFTWSVQLVQTGSAASHGNSAKSGVQVEVGQGEKVPRMLLDTSQPIGDPLRSCKRGGKDLPNLVLVQEWQTKKQRPRESITLMTQLSADR